MGLVLTQSRSVYVDSNIFIAAFENHEVKSRQLLDQENDSRIQLVTSHLTLAELLVIPYRNKNRLLQELYDEYFRSSRVEVSVIDGDIIRTAAFLRSQNRWLALPDAFHLATAVMNHCSIFLSYDMQLTKFHLPDQLPAQPPEFNRDLLVSSPKYIDIEMLFDKGDSK